MDVSSGWVSFPLINELYDLFYSYPVLLGLVSFLTGYFLMPYVIQMAKNKELIVKPNKRTSHSGGVPNIGGINIFSSFIISYLLFSTSKIDFSTRVILAGMYFVLLVGFFDDTFELSSFKKLLGELFAGILIIVIADVRLTHLHGFLGIGEIPDGISYLLSFFVYLLVINGLNLVDGVDGLASGLGILICAFFGIYFQLIGEIPLSMMGYSMIGALLIFFIYNVFGRKSKIFMGDSGSLVLGYIIYLFIVRFCEFNVHKIEEINPEYIMKSAPVVAICVLAIPLIDTLRVMITRIKKGRSPFSPDKSHVHHLLLSTGLKHKEVTYILLFVNLVFIGLGLLLRNFNIGLGILIAVALAAFLTVLLWRIVDKTAKNQKDIIE